MTLNLKMTLENAKNDPDLAIKAKEESLVYGTSTPPGLMLDENQIMVVWAGRMASWNSGCVTSLGRFSLEEDSLIVALMSSVI